MTTGTDDRFAVVERFSHALVLGDVDGVLDCYCAEAELWHNFDNLTVDPRERRQGLTEFFSTFPGRRITDVRQHATDGGLVQQHVLHLERSDGRAFVLPICVVFTFEAGRIKRRDEYVDLSRMA
jgi:ketosteroid isomerase-like protein